MNSRTIPKPSLRKGRAETMYRLSAAGMLGLVATFNIEAGVSGQTQDLDSKSGVNLGSSDLPSNPDQGIRVIRLATGISLGTTSVLTLLPLYPPARNRRRARRLLTTEKGLNEVWELLPKTEVDLRDRARHASWFLAGSYDSKVVRGLNELYALDDESGHRLLRTQTSQPWGWRGLS